MNNPSRIAGVDLARGLAVLGMLAAHLLWLGSLSWTEPSTWGAIVNGRSSILFATLAGVSLGLSTGGPTPPSGAKAPVIPGSIRSGPQPTASDTTAGTPQAMASLTTSPQVSTAVDGRTTTSDEA